MKQLRHLVVVFAVACTPFTVACTPIQTTGPKVVEGEIDCEAACSIMKEAKCEEAEPSPKKHKPCTEWCSTYHEDGTLLPWAPCVVEAGPNPDDINECNMTCTR